MTIELLLCTCHDGGAACNPNSTLSRWGRLPSAVLQTQSKRDPAPESSSAGLGVLMAKPLGCVWHSNFISAQRGAQTSKLAPSQAHNTTQLFQPRRLDQAYYLQELSLNSQNGGEGN